MKGSTTAPNQFVILADESADWRVAGLAQLERLIYALDRWAAEVNAGATISLTIAWAPAVAAANRRLPANRGIKHVQWTLALDSLGEGARVLSTRLLLPREGLADFLALPDFVEWEGGEPTEMWPRLLAEFTEACRGAGPQSSQGWRLLSRQAEIPDAEREFLRALGKPQDGPISRLINRPISRAVTTRLLQTDLSPTTWTLLTAVLPVAGFLCLAHGSYVSIVAGAVIFQVFSILDGCDGEMARATYQESARGARLDTLCDFLGNLLLVLGLGFGLWHRHPVYLLEGLLCAGLMIAYERMLRSSQAREMSVSAELKETLYPRHRGMIEHSGLTKLGEKNVSRLMQWTKRDVSIVVFLLLALANLPEWMLHLWTVVAGGSLYFSSRAAAKSGA